jgi:sulfite exporter TauE/SafE
VSDYIVSLIRTWVPILIGSGLTWASVNLGFVLDDRSSAAVVAATLVVVIGLYYALARALEARWPLLGKLLIGLGAGKAPEYDTPTGSVQVRSGTSPY